MKLGLVNVYVTIEKNIGKLWFNGFSIAIKSPEGTYFHIGDIRGLL